MLGVLVNGAAIILGSALGLLFKQGIPEEFNKSVMNAVGLAVVFIGIKGAMAGEDSLILIISLLLGAIIGELLDLDKKMNSFASFVETKMATGGKKGAFAQAFANSSILFVVGAMAIVGSINSGLSGDNTVLFSKSVLDGVTSVMMTTTMGIGVMFSCVPVMIYQGIIVLLSSLLQGLLTEEALIAEIGCCGSVMIIGIGLNMLGVTKIKIANLMPGMFVVPVIYYIMQAVM